MRYIQQRNRRYYFRYKLSPRLLPFYHTSEIKCSLGTDSYAIAASMVASKLPVIQSLSSPLIPNNSISTLLHELSDFSLPNSASRPLILPVTRNSLPDQSNLVSRKSLTIREAWDLYVSSRKWSSKVHKDKERHFDFIVAFLGNVQIVRVTKEDIKNLLVRYSLMPKRNVKPYNKLTVTEVLTLTESEELDEGVMVSSKTVRELLKVCQGFFSSFLKGERDLIDVSPTEGVRWAFDSIRYARFSDGEINLIKREVLSFDGWKKWVLLLGIYTGARRGDLVNLRGSDVKRDVETGRLYLWIAKGKTSAATRMIPIHKDIEEFGFIQFVESSGKHLFPELSNSPAAITAFMPRLIRKLGIQPFSLAGNRKVFHSFRHTFITKARGKGVELALIQQVVGHEQFQSGITRRYTHTLELKDLLVVVDSLDW